MKYFLPPWCECGHTGLTLWRGGWCVRRCWINNWSREVNNYLWFILYFTSEALWSSASHACVGAVQGGEVRSNAPVTARGRTVTILRARGTSRNLRPAQSNRQLLFILFISFLVFVRKNKLAEFGTEKRTLIKKRRKSKCGFFLALLFCCMCSEEPVFKMPV